MKTLRFWTDRSTNRALAARAQDGPSQTGVAVKDMARQAMASRRKEGGGRVSHARRGKA